MRMQPAAVVSAAASNDKRANGAKVNRYLTQADAQRIRTNFAVPVRTPLPGAAQRTELSGSSPAGKLTATEVINRRPGQQSGVMADRFLAVVDATAKYLRRS